MMPLLQTNLSRNIFLLISFLLSTNVDTCSAYSISGNHASKSHHAATSRRSFLSKSVIGNIANVAVLSSLAGSGAPAAAIEDARLVASSAETAMQDVYFGAGCFWHVQHEFVEAERALLGRKDNELTSRTGYAGGTRTDGEGRVCYHNFQSIADYGKFGHGEVVGMTIPESSIGDFAVEYFKLFGDKGERADPMDKGGEYRSLLGLPGGKNHPMYAQVEAAGKARGMTLAEGKGNDPDTLGKRLVYVMDTKKYPFYQAEIYHQYHNDFLTPAYGKEYNNLVNIALDDGRIKSTGCPDRMPNVMKKLEDLSPTEKNTILFGLMGVGISFIILGFFSWARRRFAYSSMGQVCNDGDADCNDLDTIAETEIASKRGRELDILL